MQFVPFLCRYIIIHDTPMYLIELQDARSIDVSLDSCSLLLLALLGLWAHLLAESHVADFEIRNGAEADRQDDQEQDRH
jgi:hypothetical protein